MEHRRYYVEVVGDEGKNRLIRSGIAPEQIIEIKEPGQFNAIRKIAAAISKVLSETLSTMRGPSREKKVCIARLIFVHRAIELGVSHTCLADFLNRKLPHIRWYEARFNDAVKYDKEIRILDAQVSQVLNH